MQPKTISNAEEFLRDIIEQLSTDILFECFTGLVIKSEQLDVEDIHVIPKENFRRSYKNDILPVVYRESAVKEQYFEQHDFLLKLYTSRSAILDYLPEDFYSEPDNTDEFIDDSGKKRTRDDIEEYRKKIAEELKSAQEFFRPLEVEINKVRLHRELDELNKIENFDQMLSFFWGSFDVSNEKWRRFVRTLHLISFIVGDKEKTKALIEFVLGTSISLSFSVEAYCEKDSVDRKQFKENIMHLGYSAVLGNEIYDYLDICTLTITNLSPEEFYRYFDETSEERKLLQEIIKYYFPLDVEVRLDFSIREEQPAEGEECPVPILGYSSRLS